MLASESVALKFLEYENITDILPGQAVIIQKGQEPVFFEVQKQKAYSPDIFVLIHCNSTFSSLRLADLLIGICLLRPPRFNP